MSATVKAYSYTEDHVSGERWSIVFESDGTIVTAGPNASITVRPDGSVLLSGKLVSSGVGIGADGVL